ncbi:MAG: hypothetical protein CL936_02695 [Deltaproteobacteria bacterium]|nr:hypothetical protein [Deltaproteobacteria bacterium]RPG06615.1 MAG: hypothetical protein CBC32_011015 [Proteobacteria bacterium TMED72]RPG16250.1 MAG: hypothetical protein CBB69_008810 [Phycisphaera sp. TMED9]
MAGPAQAPRSHQDPLTASETRSEAVFSRWLKKAGGYDVDSRTRLFHHEIDTLSRMQNASSNHDNDHPSESSEEIIQAATFDGAAIIRYHYYCLIPLCLLIVTIPLAILLAIGYRIILTRIVASWSATLTPKNLLVKKGVFNKVEKTIPLEKITDLSSAEGPIMRFAGIKRLGIETAGQSGTANGSLVSLLGIVDSDDFRARVLSQRDAGHQASLKAHTSELTGANRTGASDEAVLLEIKDALGGMAVDLRRIAERLEDAP